MGDRNKGMLMATVDFTLEDLKTVFATKEDVREVVREEVAEIVEPAFDAIQADIQRLDGRIADADTRVEQGFVEANQRLRRFGQAAHELLVNGDERRD